MSIRTFRNVVITISLVLSAGLAVFGLKFCFLGGIACLLKAHMLWGFIRVALMAPVFFLALFFFMIANYGLHQSINSKTNGARHE